MQNLIVNVESVAYTLIPTTRRGFYSLTTASFMALISSDRAKIVAMNDGEDKAEITRIIEEIRKATF
jgi:hypothetical protein